MESVTQRNRQQYLIPEKNNKTLISYFVKHPTAGMDPNGISAIGEQVILSLIYITLFLFSALETADWNIYSANLKNNEPVIDDSIWNVDNLIPFSS